MKVTTAKQLGSYLKDVRLRKELSQSKVASKVGIRQDTVSSFEQHPDSTKLETLFKLLASLELELEIKPRASVTPQADAIDASKGVADWKEEW